MHRRSGFSSVQAKCEGQHSAAFPRMSASIRKTREPTHQLWEINVEKGEGEKKGNKRLVMVYLCVSQAAVT